ncbi:MAG: cell division protein ZapA [Oscillospiraceae bacterium]
MVGQVKVTIFGKSYTLKTEESEVYTHRLAEVLNKKLEAVAMSAVTLTKLDAAVLVALDCVDETVKSKSNLDNIRTQIKEYVDDAGEARLKCDELQKEIRALKEQIKQLERELEIANAVASAPKGLFNGAK